MNTPSKTRRTVWLPVCAALLAATWAIPRNVHADAVTATVLGGAALLGNILHSSSHHHGYYAPPLAHPVAPVYAAPVVRPMAVPVYPVAPYYVYYPY
ncbi:MAG: hypothetical protein HQL76_04165 [Magnetococcales bacterium]|nr:hypothetical protein [Magnetococcales bacterium]